VPHDCAVLDEAAVRSFAREKLASYKTPRRVLFFSEGDFQLTGSAKVKTADLRSLVAKTLLAETLKAESGARLDARKRESSGRRFWKLSSL
jgi:hypothetical protein